MDPKRLFRLIKNDGSEAEEAEVCELLKDSVCAFGVFDGCHKGHSYLLDTAKEEAKRTDSNFIVITFDIDPDEFFEKKGFKKLQSNARRLDLLRESFNASLCVIDFKKDTASLDPSDFLDALFKSCAPRKFFAGDDVRFGSKASGTISDMREWGRAHGMEVTDIALVEFGGEPITATRIRSLLASGDIEGANVLLGRPYSVNGQVEHGVGEGANLGFRTANLSVPEKLLPLADGVYAGYVYVEGLPYKAAISVGFPPTFKGKRISNIEAHLLDFEGDLYGKPITIEFVKKLRPMKKFDDIEDLKVTIAKDIESARSLSD